MALLAIAKLGKTQYMSNMGTKNQGGRPVALEQILRTNPAAYKKMLRNIERGAWDWVAARGFGISPRAFYGYMAIGRSEVAAAEESGSAKTPSIFATFYLDVCRARANARMSAEMEVKAQDPRYWLKHVATTKPDRPGWTDSAMEVVLKSEGYNEPSVDDAEQTMRVLEQVMAGVRGDHLPTNGSE